MPDTADLLVGVTVTLAQHGACLRDGVWSRATGRERAGREDQPGRSGGLASRCTICQRPANSSRKLVRVQSGQYAGQARISKSGRSLLRWALYHAAIGAARTVAGRARLATLKAKRRGDRFAGFKALVELAAKQLRVIWGVWRSGTPYDPARAGGLRRQVR